ncbi:hypothetical protein D3C78_1861840 [compost metagenome]
MANLHKLLNQLRYLCRGGGGGKPVLPSPQLSWWAYPSLGRYGYRVEGTRSDKRKNKQGQCEQPLSCSH